MTAPHKRAMPPIPKSIKCIHIIGICGTAMGSLAALLCEQGYRVQGSDRMAYPPMSTWLENKGISIRQPWNPANIAPETDLVIVGNVCRKDNPEVIEALERRLTSISLPEALKVFCFADKSPLVVTGTHGKTTTSALLAWILESCGRHPSFFIGGVTGNFNSTYKIDQGSELVIEGDEYDTAYFDKVPKFWHYRPFHGTINNIEFDHADIYPNIGEIEYVFERFATLLPKSGSLWVNSDDQRAVKVSQNARCRVYRFGFAKNADLRADNVCYDQDGVRFELIYKQQYLGQVVSPLIGEHNVRNLMGALGIAFSLGLNIEQIKPGLLAFKGVLKRQQIKGTVGGIRVIDDFAHHPTAIRETLKALKNRYPNRTLRAIFELKSNTSRRKIFQHDYPKALALADHVLLSSPWRGSSVIDPDTIDLNQVVEDIKKCGTTAKLLTNVDDIVDTLVKEVSKGDIVVGFSGSDFGGLHDKLLNRLKGDIK